jgi:hypothetical protein
MKIVGASLQETLRHVCLEHPDQMPFDHASHSYWERYNEIAQKLDRDFHCQVMAGSSATDGGLLTDHGPNHIKTVINRASSILNNPKNDNELTGYEIYLLLCSIHFHDLGNIFGREKHEKRVAKMMEHVSQYLGDSTEKSLIRQIAATHGGKVDGNKNTISFLPPSAALNGQDVRPRLLAAILRFADELADDHHRANKILLQLGVVPKKSLIYHKYADCLNSVMVRDECKSIELNYSMNIVDLEKKYPKYDEKSKRYRTIYILDEILDRLLKMYLERIYCNRFMTPVVHIHSILVKIRTLKENENIGDNLPNFDFRLEEIGYPLSNNDGVYAYSEDLNNWPGIGKRLNGNNIAKTLKTEKTVEGRNG